MSEPTTLQFTRRNLPHWYVEDRPYFITFRLKDTLPAWVVRQYEGALRRAETAGASVETARRIQQDYFQRIETILDHGECGARHLEDPAIAKLVMDSFDWLEQERHWVIHAATVMPNHVHLCLEHSAAGAGDIGQDIGSLKKFTARRANDLLGRRGAFWQRENFDHWCRNPRKVDNCVRYIVRNPVTAGICAHWTDWRWTRVHPRYHALL